MVGVAQMVEPQVVILVVAGSIPVTHPTMSLGTPLIWLWENLVIRLVRDEENVRSNRTSQTRFGCLKFNLHVRTTWKVFK